MIFGPESLAALADCAETERACASAVWIGQPVLLGDRHDMDDIVEAAWKINRA